MLVRQQTVPLTPILKPSDNSKMCEEQFKLKRSNSQNELDPFAYNLLDLNNDVFAGIRQGNELTDILPHEGYPNEKPYACLAGLIGATNLQG